MKNRSGPLVLCREHMGGYIPRISEGKRFFFHDENFRTDTKYTEVRSNIFLYDLYV